MTESTLAAVALGGIFTLILVSVILWLLYIIGYWKTFAKAGEPGWKAIIPFYNTYICYKISWKAAWPFWVFFIGGIVSVMLQTYYADNNAMLVVSGVLSLAASVTHIVQSYKLSSSFGHGIGFTLGLILFNPLFVIILGFGGSKYQGAR